MVEDKKWKTINNLLDGLRNRLKSQWEESRKQSFNSNVKGASYEKTLANFLQEYIGGTYDIYTRIAVIDRKLKCFDLFTPGQNEIDVVASFPQAKPQIVFELEEMTWVPYYGVAFICEVKSELSTTALKEDLKKTGKLSKMERTSEFGVSLKTDSSVEYQLKCLVYDKAPSIDIETVYKILEKNMENWDLVLIVEKDVLLVHPDLPFGERLKNPLFYVKVTDRGIVHASNGLIWFLLFLSVSIDYPPSIVTVNSITNMLFMESMYSLMVNRVNDEQTEKELKEKYGVKDEVKERVNNNQIDLENIDNLNYLAGLLAKNGRLEEAKEHYQKALEIDSESKLAHHNLADLLKEEEKYEKAEKHYQKVIKIGSKDESGYQNLTELQIIKGEFEEAIDLSKEALNLSDELGKKAISLILLVISKEMLDEDNSDEIEELKEICEKEFELTWGFEEMDTWLEDAKLDEEKEEKIKEIIDLVREHKTA